MAYRVIKKRTLKSSKKKRFFEDSPMTREEQKLAGAIAKLDPARGFVDNFDSFIDFALFPFLANPTEKEVKAFNECKRNERYLQALQDLGEHSEGYHDCLGDMFMDNRSHGSNSQFFTPENFCEFMAGITDNQGESVCDPTCGSGRLLLKGLANSRKHDLEPRLYGCDLDHRCVRMTLLNLCLNSARGDIQWGNSLSMQIYKTYHIDRVMLGGRWMSFVWQYFDDDDMEELSNKRRETILQLASMGIPYEPPFERQVITIEQPAVEVEQPAEVPAEKPAPSKPSKPVQLQLEF